MIQLASEFRVSALTLKLFTPASPQECELFDVLESIYRVAYSYVKKKWRLFDRFMIQEAAQEAVFVVTELIYVKFQEIVTKYPDVTERHRFYMAYAGFKLRNYFGHRASSSISYLKKKGIKQEMEELSDVSLSRPDAKTEQMIALDHACRNEYERLVVQYFCMGHDYELIAEKLGSTLKRVKKTLRRVKNRLRTK